MKNNNMTSNTTSNTTTTTKQSKTTNGIRKIFSTGTYRVEKQIQGKRYSANFKKRKDAMNFLTLLNNEAKKLKG